MSALAELVETMQTAGHHMAEEPESRNTEDAVMKLVRSLRAAFDWPELTTVDRLTPEQRAYIAEDFRRLLEGLRQDLDVGKQIQRLGGQAPWTKPLAESLEGFEQELKRRGLYHEPGQMPPPRVYRDESTGKLRVAPPAPLDTYITLATRNARPRELEEGGWVVELDGFPGIWADGSSPEECLAALNEVLQDWLMIKLAFRDDDVPVVGGIDLAALLRR